MISIDFHTICNQWCHSWLGKYKTHLLNIWELHHPLSFTLIHSYPLLSILIHSYSFSSILIHSYPFSSTLIHSYPLLSILIHSYPFSSTLIHSQPLLSILIHSHPHITWSNSTFTSVNDFCDHICVPICFLQLGSRDPDLSVSWDVLTSFVQHFPCIFIHFKSS